MGVIDFNPKLADIKARIKNLNIGLNKDEKKILIQALDESTHMHYHNEIGLSNEDILRLPAEDIGNFVKHKTLLNLKAAFKDRPKEMQKYLAMYDSTALTTGASIVTASAPTFVEKETSMPSGDFVEQLPGAIEASIPPNFISVGEEAELEIEEENNNKKIQKPQIRIRKTAEFMRKRRKSKKE